MEEVFYMFWMLFAKCDPDICINSVLTYILTIVDCYYLSNEQFAAQMVQLIKSSFTRQHMPLIILITLK